MEKSSKHAYEIKQSPILFDPKFEVLETDESKISESLIQTLLNISATTFKHSGHATRSVHAKKSRLIKRRLRGVR